MITGAPIAAVLRNASRSTMNAAIGALAHSVFYVAVTVTRVPLNAAFPDSTSTR